MLANEGNPFERRNHLIHERLEKNRQAHNYRRAQIGAIWIASILTMTLGVFLLSPNPGAALVALGLLGMATAWLAGVSK